MSYENINFQSYSWVLGTTSFRVAQMNLRIEEQLIHLRSFSQTITDGDEKWRWKGNRELQARFYYYLKDNNALKGDARRPDKDARQKTSGLLTLGFIDDNRIITPAGEELLNYVEDASFGENNYFMIPADSFIYLKQLLKTSLRIREDANVRPYFVLAHFLNKFGSLTFEEFTYLLPLVVDEQSLHIVETSLTDVRSGRATFNEVILSTLMSKQNYKQAYDLWMTTTVDERLVTQIGMNRKSRKYDRAYYPFYQLLKQIFVEKRNTTRAVSQLYQQVRNLKTATYWKRLIFGDSSSTKVRRNGADSFAQNNPFTSVSDEAELKDVFFKYLHLYKARATLSDYFDLNRRYFKLTDTVLFRENTVRFDSIPSAFFSLVGDKLLASMFEPSETLTQSLELKNIAPMFNIPEVDLLTALSSKLGVKLTTLSEVNGFVQDKRYERLHHLLDDRFTKKVLMELLDCFITRNDERVKELVTEDATPSTIFEYVLALIWYEFTDRQGDVLRFMKLSFDADLMPRTHAQGGGADIVFEFEPSGNYPRHDMLIEATLADGTNTRRMEMEPVSRHLGTHILQTGNHNDYCVFVAPHIEVNVANDFRFRKNSGYWNNQGDNTPLKIIPVDIAQVKYLVENDSRYCDLYRLFEEAYDSPELTPLKWLAEIAQLVASLPGSDKSRSERDKMAHHD
ncbi:AlwI family type II restriction endonuclease [Cutibacterium sp.]|uniref:AlwI family type II restriction endonuclease n=1 Tax=Cutibacterium sp. TaxID=1912221 RepID=UPI0026DAE3BE|nr:AlwI family type II restriction endonuclease [Cutibacterium sp.]MDO4413302.1 AlwI family type II restriction endonuclease [Cutibacterium sp.]